MVPASLDFWRANLNREASSDGTSIPSDNLNPTALARVVQRVEHVDRESTLVEHVGPPDAVDCELGDFGVVGSQ